MAISVTIICSSIKKIKDYDEPKDDFGMGLKNEGKEAWLVKFKIDLGGKKMKPAFTYESEGDARKWGEGRSYTPLEWLEMAFG